jgi:lysophospholipase L1-like esterase
VSLVTATLVAGAVLVAVPGVSQAARLAPATKPAPLDYLSLGDSYSIGYQPGLPGGGGSPGYTAYVAKKQKLTLENFGCGGATTTSILDSVGCGDPAATDAVAYPDTTQEAAAVAFIEANPGKVALVTVSIGGNDITACASNADPVGCVQSATTTVQTNVTTLVDDLSTALLANGDGTARIVGITYPDVILGDWVYPSGATNQTLAEESVVAFDDFVNPALDTAYTSVTGGSFVNVTTAPYKLATAGDDTSFGSTTKLKPYGTIPDNVWEICTLTYFCSQGNIHANTKGYTFIGKLIEADLVSTP